MNQGLISLHWSK